MIENNFLFKGDNLEVMKKILPKFKGKIKLIYIDPPYNTGNKFNYNDNFSSIDMICKEFCVDEKEARKMKKEDKWIGSKVWLSFMRKRLEIAREFLRDDGVIFVQCDDNEQAYLKVLMDEIFGRDNFVNSIIWHYRTYQGKVDKNFPRKHDTILLYKKLNIDTFKFSYQDNYKETVDFHRWKKFYVGNKIIYPNYPKNDSRFYSYLQKYIREKGEPNNGDVIYCVKGYVIDDVWCDIKAIDAKDKKEKLSFLGGQKPEKLLHRVIYTFTNTNDTILDFFAGSGTTLAVAHKMGRKWIGIEQMDYIQDITKERLKKVIDGEQGGISKAVEWKGGGGFTYIDTNENIIEYIK